MLVNNTQVVDRFNRPNVNQKVGLRTFFINDGLYVDPYEISSVQIFYKTATLTPKSVLGEDNLVSSVPLMTFAGTAQNTQGNWGHCTRPVGGTESCASGFAEAQYPNGGADNASGIYRLGVGDYVCVLDQTLALSGWDYTNDTQVAASAAGVVGDYVDLWTVKLAEASKYQVMTNEFSLYEDTFLQVTEPLMLTSKAKLLNKHVRMGEIIDLKVTTENTLQNKNIPESVQNIFKDSVITSADITIAKVNNEPTYTGPFVVVPSSDNTTASMEITSDNTLLYSWNTDSSITPSNTFGSGLGTYSVQVSYKILNQTFISPLLYLTVS